MRSIFIFLKNEQQRILMLQDDIGYATILFSGKTNKERMKKTLQFADEIENLLNILYNFIYSLFKFLMRSIFIFLKNEQQRILRHDIGYATILFSGKTNKERMKKTLQFADEIEKESNIVPRK
jgi:hypothetical protein